LGQALIPELIRSGWRVRTLARPGSEGRVPAGAEAVIGDALDASTYAARVEPASTFVHLVGVARPAPWKAAQFRAVDFGSARASLAAAAQAGAGHFVYVSVAQPAPVMKAYVAVRAECEGLVRASGLNATILRPWYVLGPGHRWPYVLLPFYRLFERLPATAASARRLGLVTRAQMTEALLRAVEHPAAGIRIVEVGEIRRPEDRRRAP
jgi:uncharacterized protein YbjT (DUF2867 family)